MGLEPTILPLGGARLIHLATQAAYSPNYALDCAHVDSNNVRTGTLAEWLRR